MVDATFFFIVLFGGALVGLVTALVRRHRGLRLTLDVIAGTLGGFGGTPLWIAFVRHLLPRIVGPLDGVTHSYAALAADMYYLSPVLGGFLGVGALSLAYRFLSGRRRDEPWLAALGDVVKIVGIVYLGIALSLTLALMALAAYQARWDLVSPTALSIDLVYGAAIVLAGWAMTRASRRPA